MALETLPLPDADVALDPAWMAPAEAGALLQALLTQVPWGVHRVRLFGREHESPRLSCWIGDPDAHYRYSGTRHAPHPWPAALLPVRERLARELGVPFNSVLANRYRDGRDCMGWHRDDERDLGPAPVIASVSLGATRRFVLRHVDRADERVALELASGSLLVMGEGSQRHYRHALPRTARPVGERVNLTFRWVKAAGS
ncbi:alpha-ketoglutarate-dependent dioxygenase AlkB family protein [Lysobacter sp. A3-1-A15]|uniref:alpha-ketoglutarate-dependent dioxygenase AlkB family protein n=1 Tax=Novilysobacter viscosus TaxID=3098602 RepID=UPI002ED93413